MIDYVMQNDGLQRQKKFAEITFESTPNRPQFIRPSAQLEKKHIWDILKKALRVRSPCFDMCKIKLLLSCFKEKYVQRPKIVRLFHQM